MERRKESEAQVTNLYPLQRRWLVKSSKRLRESFSINSNDNFFVMDPLTVVCMPDIC